MPGLGYRFQPDERDKAHPLRMAARREVGELPKSKYWWTRFPLDQGDTPMCVGFATRQFLSSSPVPDISGPGAEEIYAGARRLDEWPGENYEGTSGRGAMKFLQSIGYIEEYQWTWDIKQAMEFVLLHGTLLLGIKWTKDMFTPDGHGIIHPTGKDAGGHEVLVRGVDRTRGLFQILNSWGADWGTNGRAFILGEDLDKFLGSGDADLILPVQSPMHQKPKVPTP